VVLEVLPLVVAIRRQYGEQHVQPKLQSQVNRAKIPVDRQIQGCLLAWNQRSILWHRVKEALGQLSRMRLRGGRRCLRIGKA
jgi:hypothetical protein